MWDWIFYLLIGRKGDIMYIRRKSMKMKRCNLFFVKRFLAVLFITLISTVILTGSTSSQKLERYRLPNGMVVLLYPDGSTPAVAMNVWISVGSFNESEDEGGISHFLEHLSFKGTEELKPGEGAAIIEASGGYANAYTSFDSTVYTANVASRFVEDMIRVVGDSVLNATVPEVEVENERKVILEEIRMNMDSPGRRIIKFMLEKSFPGHPYGKPILGTVEKVKLYTRDDINRYRKAYYVPSNMTLVLVGDFEPALVKPMIEKYFDSGRKRETVRPAPSVRYPTNSGLTVSGLYENVNMGYLKIGFNIPPIDHEDLYALDVSSLILGEGRGSRLYHRLVDKEKLVYSINAFSYTPKRAGLYLISANLGQKNMNEAVSTILEEIVALRTGGVTEEELINAKTSIKTDFVYGKETFKGLCSTLGYFETVIGDVRFEESYLKNIDRVTEADIKRVAKKYFNEKNLTVTYLLPEGAAGTVTEKGVVEAVHQGFKKGGGEEAVSLRAELVPGEVGFKAKLKNGITLVIKEEPELPIVSVVAIFPGGVRYEDEDNNGINKLMSRMLTRGTEDLTAKALTDRIDSIAGSVNGFSGRNSFGVMAQFLKEHEDEGWEIFSDVILNPTFDSDELEKAREKALAAKDSEADNLVLTVMRLFRETLYGDHPYSMPKTGTKENIKKFTRDDLMKYYRAHAVASEMIIAVVGDVKAEDVLKRMEELFEAMPTAPAQPLDIERPKRPDSPKRVVTRVRGKEQAHIGMGFLGVDLKNDDLYSLEVLTAILSGHGGRLFAELREKRGLAYAVTAVNMAGPDPGFFGVYMATKPENLKVAVRGMEGELIKVRDGGVTAVELERAKNYIVGNYEISLQKNMDMAMVMATDELYGLGYDFFTEYPKKILAVTVDDVKRAAEKYIDFDGKVTAIVKP